MPKYRKKPVVIEAYKWEPNGIEPAPPWLLEALLAKKVWSGRDCLIIETLEGDHKCDPGDFIIQSVKGELYPCKPDIFALTYEAV